MLFFWQKIMKRNILLALSGLGALFCNALAESTPTSPIPSDDEIRSIIVDRIDNQKQSLGIVVGVIEPTGRRLVAYGSLDAKDKRPLNGDTVFEIGTTTKVFTSLLLADMAQHGEVALTDPVAKFLPKTVKLPERILHITLQDLATHTSGLPRNPTNLFPENSDNPYADYTTKKLYEFLTSYRLSTDPPAEWEYSNVGGGLLGHALALRAAVSYEALVRTRIADPLGMKSTGITLSHDMVSRFAVGHDSKLNPVSPWDFQVLAGAGALRSTANDLLNFLAAVLGYSKTPLAPAMASMLKVRRPTTWDVEMENALGWQVSSLTAGRELIRKDGATYGFSSFIGYDPKLRVGVVALSNAFSATGVNDIGLHLLDQHYPLQGRKQREVSVDPKLYDNYVGTYQLGPTVSLTITREEKHLFATMIGQQKFEIFPQSDINFFYKIFNSQITFEPDSQGRATSLILHFSGKHQRAKRIEEQASSPK
jgi:CubicO group peptidase (beta-lactamase class C family)